MLPYTGLYTENQAGGGGEGVKGPWRSAMEEYSPPHTQTYTITHYLGEYLTICPSLNDIHVHVEYYMYNAHTQKKAKNKKNEHTSTLQH